MGRLVIKCSICSVHNGAGIVFNRGPFSKNTGSDGRRKMAEAKEATAALLIT